MSDAANFLKDRYLAVIDQIIAATLKGQIRSKQQVYDQLVQELETGTEEVFEACWGDRMAEVEQDLQSGDELRQAKAMRRQRALNNIHGEWQRYRDQQQQTGALAAAVQSVLSAPSPQRLRAWITTLDPNHLQALTLDQQLQLAQKLQALPSIDPTLVQMPKGIRQGIAAWKNLELYLVAWMYERPAQVGFGQATVRGPWTLWAEQVGSVVLRQFFKGLSDPRQGLVPWLQKHPTDDGEWVELAIVLQQTQQGLVNWAEAQTYDIVQGRQIAMSIYLTWMVLWSQLASAWAEPENTWGEGATRDGADAQSGDNQENATEMEAIAPLDRKRYSEASFQMLLPLLRSFAQKTYFPLYGGMVTLMSNGSVGDLLAYLDRPLKQTANTAEKARILTLLGYSQQVMQHPAGAEALHQEALEISQLAGDSACAVANLNHLSRMHARQKNIPEASRYAQQALILARQVGDPLGQANALTNVGYCEIAQARALERLDPEVAQRAIAQLQQGLRLAQAREDILSQALCQSSLGLAYSILEQTQEADAALSQAVDLAQATGDRYLLGLNLLYLAEAKYSNQDRNSALYLGLVGMFLLHQLQAQEWRQAAGLISILQGQTGELEFARELQELRSRLISAIGSDGYDVLPQLLADYRGDGGG
jgi:tetratricopeptide (TPR) repeat protein